MNQFTDVTSLVLITSLITIWLITLPYMIIKTRKNAGGWSDIYFLSVVLTLIFSIVFLFINKSTSYVLFGINGVAIVIAVLNIRFGHIYEKKEFLA